MTSFLSSLLSAFTRRWTRNADRQVASNNDRQVASNNDRLPGILAGVPAVVWEASGQRITFISDHVTRMLGYTVEECLAMPDFWRSVAHPEDRDVVAKEAPFRCMAKDGRAVWVEMRVTNDGTRGVAVQSSGGTGASPVLKVVRQARAPVAPPEVRDLRGKHVLLVDREEASIAAITGLLEQRGARVTAVRSATEAILSLHVHYDLVITDVGVVVADGVTLAQQLRQANGGLPAIVLRKPLDPAALTAEIEQAINR